MQAQEDLPGDDFLPVCGPNDIEKVYFPSTEKPIPTFSAAFGSVHEAPPPRQMFPANTGYYGHRVGPRFYSSASSEPFETDKSVSPISVNIPTVPPAAHSRWSSSTEEKDALAPLHRYNSRSEYDGYDASVSSHYRKNSTASSESSGRKRWVIE